MKEPEKHLSALCRLYLEVALIDPEHGVCRLLSTDTSGTFLRNTEAFDAVTIGELAGQHVAPEDRQRFSDFFHPRHLLALRQNGAPRELRFSRISGREHRTVVVSAVPSSNQCVLCTFRYADLPQEPEPESIYHTFLRQFLQLLEKLFDAILELDMDTGRARVLRAAPYGCVGKDEYDWTEFLAFCRTEGVHEEDRAALAALFSLESLRSFAGGSDGYRSTEARFLRNGVYIWVEIQEFCIRLEGKTRVLITLSDIDQKKLLQSIVDRYVYKNCDYFIYLDANRNRYIMFGSNDSGTPLPPVVCDDYATELVKYARAFVAPEDVEMTIREMQVDRVLEQLELHGEHAFNVGIMDPVRGYTRKRLQYIYYDRPNRMILLTRTDITRVYEEEKELKRVKHEAQTDSLTGLYNHKTSLRLIGERLAACPDAPATVLFVDLDNFKQVNDRLGHLRGDELLRSLGKTFRDVLRPTDVLGRLGGDEFILFLPGVSRAESVNRCVERLRAAFSALLDDSLRSCGVTCSIGVARYPEDGGDCVTLIRKADAALYIGKRSGKNRAVFAEQADATAPFSPEPCLYGYRVPPPSTKAEA